MEEIEKEILQDEQIEEMLGYFEFDEKTKSIPEELPKEFYEQLEADIIKEQTGEAYFERMKELGEML